MPLVARDGDHCANTRLCMCAERPDREGESAKHGSDSRGARGSGMSRMRSAWRQLRAKRLERAPELGKRVPTRQVAELGQLSSSVDLQVRPVGTERLGFLPNQWTRVVSGAHTVVG